MTDESTGDRRLAADRYGATLLPGAKPAGACSDMGEIRAEIDRIDHLTVGLLAERLAYVRAAAGFKTSDESVRALDRVAAMLGDRERWATERGLDPGVVRSIYEQLIGYFTARELEEWHDHRPAAE